jgi:molybdate transport system ATP-binding protein
MRQIHVCYGNLTVINGLSWTVRQGEKWMVKGPNGSGKSTLLSLIAGDNPQAYSNEIYLFGQKRGSGESIWDIKKRIGLVSSEFQLRYQRDLSVLDVVLSGFFDSVGLYRKPSDEHRSTARSWLSILGFEKKADNLFTHLSFGEQKLVLIARAMVKSPELLILDEPCQGLDPVNRRNVLQLIETIGQIPETTMIYVTHHSEEILSCFDRVLCL